MGKIELLTSEDFEIKKRKPRILIWDTENAPNKAYVWGKWKQNVIEYESEWYFLAWSVKELGGKQITKALSDYEGYVPGSEDDKALVTELWEHLNSADILIAHNGDRHDTRKAYTRFIEHGLMPPQPSKSIDTLKIARRKFAFNSNRLDDLGRRLGVGRKLKHSGFDLWKGCMEGDLKSWNTMKKYCAQDVRLLENVYERLLPYIDNHPNVAIIQNKSEACRNCGSTKLQKRGTAITATGVRPRMQCQSCGTWMQGAHVKITEVR